MNESNLSLEALLQETLTLTEYLRGQHADLKGAELSEHSLMGGHFDEDYLSEIADDLVSSSIKRPTPLNLEVSKRILPESPGIIYKIDNGNSTFCIRGYSVHNIKKSFIELEDLTSSKRGILKLVNNDLPDSVDFFSTKSFELAESVREQVINRRFPHQEDSVCNISDPGFSWWMNIESDEVLESQGRFEIFFRSHGINRAEKYIQLGPIGDGGVAALRMNQARTLLRSSFPISEFSCDDKSFTVASLKPEHSSFISFKNIFLEGVNHTELENFPDNSIGRSLFYYFHELAIVRKFWIEVKSKLG